MSVRTLLVIALAIVCGGSSAVGIFMLKGGETAEETVTVVVAASPITRGEVVTTPMLVTRDWPLSLVPPNAVREVSDVVNRTVLTPISPGEPILLGKLTEGNTGGGLAALIPEGRRAYTIQTSRVASNVAGFVLPGNRVDVLLTLRGGFDDETGGGSSTTLLQAVEILAVDQRLDAQAGELKADPQQLRSVTLLVTPDQASLLDLGANMGTLSLSLRNPGDVAEAETSPATLNVLRFTQREPVEDAEPKDKSLASNWLAAAAAIPKAMMMARSLTPPADPEPQRDYVEVQTLRGRHAGRILVRNQR